MSWHGQPAERQIVRSLRRWTAPSPEEPVIADWPATATRRAGFADRNENERSAHQMLALAARQD